MAGLTKPAEIHWVDGSQEEYERLCAQMVESGTFIKLNQKLWPGCYYARSDASDVARVEDRTFICSLSKDNAGPTNNWVNPFEMRRKLKELFSGCMRGPHHVRAAVQHGPGRLADVADRRAAHRFALRRGQHAHHGAHRHAGLRRDRQGREARRAVHAQRRRAAGAGPEGCAVAVQQGEVHRPFPGDARDLVLRLRLRRQCAAGQEVLRAAHRLQHRARRGLDGRAHADPRRRESARARRPTSPPRFPAPAARPTSPC